MSWREQTQFPGSSRKMSLVADIGEPLFNRQFVTLLLLRLWAKADAQAGTKDGAVLELHRNDFIPNRMS